MSDIERPATMASIPGGRCWLLIIGLLLVGWLVVTPQGLLGKADALGYAVCHRIDARSFHIADRQMPLCSRCTGMYLGAVLGLAAQLAIAPRRAGMPQKSHWIVLGLLVASFAADGLNSYLKFFPNAPTFYDTTNLSRLITGSGMGLVVALLIYPAFNQSIWKKLDMRPALTGTKMLTGLIIGMSLLDWLVFLQNPFLLYLFALISAAGILILLAMIYAVFCLFLFKKENQYENNSQIILPLVLGFGTASLQVAVFNWVRFMLTGTWDGFIIG